MVKWGTTMTIENNIFLDDEFQEMNIIEVIKFWNRMESVFGRSLPICEIRRIKKRMDELEKEVNNG